MRRPALARSVVAVMLLGACAEPVAPKGAVEHVLMVSGGGQAGRTLDTLPEPLVVALQDDGREPVSDAEVRWTADDATARIIPVDRVTRDDGTARALVVLGFSPGASRIRATVPGFDDGVEFELTAEARPVFKAVSLMHGPWSDHMCALDADGRAWCWGANSYGQLGNGVATPANNVPAPIPVQTSLRFTRLWGTWSATCGLTAGHELWCWGQNYAFAEGAGTFGNGNTESSAVPVRSGGGLLFRDVDFDLFVACGVTLDDEAYCWGWGVLGDGMSLRTSAAPVRVSGSERWREIAVEDSRICAINHDNVMFCWARGEPDIVGLPAPILVPTRVPGIPPLMQLSLGSGFAPSGQCGMSANGGGVPVCWGGNGVTYPRPEGAPGVNRIEIGAESAMLRTLDGRLWIWGAPPHCCDGFISGTPEPLAPAGPWTDFAISGFGAFGISEADGGVYRWSGFGFGPPGELLPRPVPAPEVE